MSECILRVRFAGLCRWVGCGVDVAHLGGEHEADGVGVFRLFFKTKRPSSASVSSFSILAKCSGWVKSPVPMRLMPLSLAQWARFGSVISLLVALEKPVWIWRSAIIRMGFYGGLGAGLKDR